MVLLGAGWLFATQACAERAMFVWSMTQNIVMDATSKSDFFNFCAAPKGTGDPAKAIKVVFIDALVGDLMANQPAALRQFLSDAHSRNIKVEFLEGDKSWATPQNMGVGEALVDRILAFNQGTTNTTQRFDGIHFDVEPYLLNTKSGNDPLDWNYDQGLIWTTYLTFLSDCQAKVNTYNAGNAPQIRFGVDIPYWLVLNAVPGPQDVIDRVNYVGVMAYKDTPANIISAAQDEINYAASAGKKVYIDVETSMPTDSVNFPPSTTFYEEGNAAMETALAQVETNFSGASSYAGMAMHYYEDLTGPKGYESSYRRLWSANDPVNSSYQGHHPVVSILSPHITGERWFGSVAVIWDGSDLDGNVMTIDIQYSTDAVNWTTLAAGLPNTPSYYIIDTSATPRGNYYLKVIATDSSTNHLVGYKVSPMISISDAGNPAAISDLVLWNESATALRMKWTPPKDPATNYFYTPLYYKIYRSVNGGPFNYYTVWQAAVNYFVDGAASSTSKYRYQVQPIYKLGTTEYPSAMSNASNMLIPGSDFLLDYFEGNEGLTYAGPYGTSTLVSSANSTAGNFIEGNQSVQFNYTYAGSGWGAIELGNFPVTIDASPYTAIKLWVKGGTAGQKAFAVKLYETGQAVNEEWISPQIVISNTAGADVTLNLADFVLDSARGDGRLNLHSLSGYGIIFTASSANGTYYADQMRLVNLAANIGISPLSYSFGTLTPTAAAHRFRTDAISVSYSGLNPPWTIRIWTNNGGGGSHAGLVGADNASFIPLKVWCANYGPATVPDPNDDTYWVNNSTGWFRIPEYSEMVSNNVYTWRRLVWSPGGELANPFNINLAIDTAGGFAEQYSTNTLTIEFINQ